MLLQSRFVALTLALAVAACVHSKTESSGDADTDDREHAVVDEVDREQAGNLAGACADIGTSTLPGVCIAFATDELTWTLAEVAAGVTISYEVIVEAELDGVVPRPQDGGRCGRPGPSGLITFARISGGDHHYCICDSGLCPYPDDAPTTIPAGRSFERFDWSGRNWDGPSDTNNPMGEPFAPGTYTLEVSAVGQHDGGNFEVRNELTIELTP